MEGVYIISALKNLVRKLLRFAGLQPTSKFPFVLRRAAYRKPRRLSRAIGPDFFAPVSLTATHEHTDVRTDELYDIWQTIPGAHKWMHYFNTYHRVVAHFENRPIRMLEIGVYRGGSLRMWRKYLPKDSIIVGIDIDPSCKQFEKEDENLYVRIGDQSNRAFLEEIVAEFGPFDLILDDGSHMCSHMIASFRHLFISGLRDKGVYLVEDTHSNFWPSYRDKSYSFIDLAKDLVDIMHAHYWLNHSELKFRKGHRERVDEAVVPKICSEIGEIRFEDSLVTIYKARQKNLPMSVHL